MIRVNLLVVALALFVTGAYGAIALTDRRLAIAVGVGYLCLVVTLIFISVVLRGMNGKHERPRSSR